MPYPLWQLVPPTTQVRDLFSTSLLIFSPDASPGILARFSTGLDEGTATAVLATTRRPDALAMMGIDDDERIGKQAQTLLGVERADVMAIPHITWKRLGKGLAWRTPITGVVALFTAALLYVPPLSWSPWAITPIAVFLGLIVWLLLRERIPTSIGPPDAPHISVDDVVKRATFSHIEVPRSKSSAVRLPKGSRRWAPPVS